MALVVLVVWVEAEGMENLGLVALAVTVEVVPVLNLELLDNLDNLEALLLEEVLPVAEAVIITMVALLLRVEAAVQEVTVFV